MAFNHSWPPLASLNMGLHAHPIGARLLWNQKACTGKTHTGPRAGRGLCLVRDVKGRATTWRVKEQVITQWWICMSLYRQNEKKNINGEGEGKVLFYNSVSTDKWRTQKGSHCTCQEYITKAESWLPHTPLAGRWTPWDPLPTPGRLSLIHSVPAFQAGNQAIRNPLPRSPGWGVQGCWGWGFEPLSLSSKPQKSNTAS